MKKETKYMTKPNQQDIVHYQRRTPAAILKLESKKIPKELYLKIGKDKKLYDKIHAKVELADDFSKSDIHQKVKQQIVEELLGYSNQIDDLFKYAIEEGFDKGENYNDFKLSVLAEKMLAKKRADNMSKATIEQNEREVKVVIEIIGDIHIEEITVEHITNFKNIINNLPPRLGTKMRAIELSEWINLAKENIKEKDEKKKIETTISEGSKNHYISALKTIMNYYALVNTKYSIPKIEYYEEGVSERKGFTKQEVRMIAKTTPDYECSKWISKNDVTNGLMNDMISLYYYTGLRLTEISFAKLITVHGVTSIDLTYKSVVTEQKGRLKTKNSYRIIPLHSEALKHYNNIKDFISKRTVKSLSNKFKAHISSMGFDDDYTFHSLRHTFASTLGNNNVPHEISQLLMGHKLDITGMYAKEKEFLFLKEMIERIPNVLANENREYLK